MSISSYLTVLELHDLENDDYKFASAKNFFQNEQGIPFGTSNL